MIGELPPWARHAAVLLLLVCFAAYSMYALEYSSAYNAVCKHAWGIRQVDDGLPSLSSLVLFAIALLPILLCRRDMIFLMICAMVIGLLLSAATLLDPYDQIERSFGCPSLGGNNEDERGAYVDYYLGYVVMIAVFYAVLVVDWAIGS